MGHTRKKKKIENTKDIKNRYDETKASHSALILIMRLIQQKKCSCDIFLML